MRAGGREDYTFCASFHLLDFELCECITYSNNEHRSRLKDRLKGERQELGTKQVRNTGRAGTCRGWCPEVGGSLGTPGWGAAGAQFREILGRRWLGRNARDRARQIGSHVND